MKDDARIADVLASGADTLPPREMATDEEGDVEETSGCLVFLIAPPMGVGRDTLVEIRVKEAEVERMHRTSTRRVTEDLTIFLRGCKVKAGGRASGRRGVGEQSQGEGGGRFCNSTSFIAFSRTTSHTSRSKTGWLRRFFDAFVDHFRYLKKQQCNFYESSYAWRKIYFKL
jgi:hypothetical protein